MSKLSSLLMLCALATASPALAAETCSTGTCEVPNISEKEKAILINEQKGLWKEINWQTEVSSAVQAAKKSGNPILVVLSVGQRGQADAEDT